MTYDPNREPRARDPMGRDRGMWGWIIAIAAVIILGIIVWAAVDTEPDVAETTPPATQGTTSGTVGSAPKDTTGGTPAGGSGTQPGGSPKSGATPGSGGKQ